MTKAKSLEKCIYTTKQLLEKYPDDIGLQINLDSMLKQQAELTEEWPETPSIDMAVAMIHELDIKLDQVLKELKELRKTK
jgi:hypothetical protein